MTKRELLERNLEIVESRAKSEPEKLPRPIKRKDVRVGDVIECQSLKSNRPDTVTQIKFGYLYTNLNPPYFADNRNGSDENYPLTLIARNGQEKMDEGTDNWQRGRSQNSDDSSAKRIGCRPRSGRMESDADSRNNCELDESCINTDSNRLQSGMRNECSICGKQVHDGETCFPVTAPEGFSIRWIGGTKTLMPTGWSYKPKQPEEKSPEIAVEGWDGYVFRVHPDQPYVMMDGIDKNECDAGWRYHKPLDQRIAEHLKGRM